MVAVAQQRFKQNARKLLIWQEGAGVPQQRPQNARLSADAQVYIGLIEQTNGGKGRI